MECPMCGIELNKDNSLSFYSYEHKMGVICQPCRERINEIVKQSENDTKEIKRILKHISCGLGELHRKQDKNKKDFLKSLRKLEDGKMTYKRKKEEMVITIEQDLKVSKRESIREGRKLAEIIEMSKSMNIETYEKSMIITLENNIPVVELESKNFLGHKIW